MTCPIQPSLNAYIRSIEHNEIVNAIAEEEACAIMRDQETLINLAHDIVSHEDTQPDIEDAMIKMLRERDSDKRAQIALDTMERLVRLLEGKIDDEAAYRAQQRD